VSLSPEELRAEAELRVRRALAHIQQAQNALGSACSELSALEHGYPTQQAVSKVYDRVHELWYRVQRFQQSGRFRLDRTNVEALERRQAAPQP
jgi:hypothetical protein